MSWGKKRKKKKGTSRAKKTLLPCMPCGRVRGTGSLRRNEDGSMSVPLCQNETDELVKWSILGFISGI